MKHARNLASVAVLAASAGLACADDIYKTYRDVPGDAVIRRTDLGNDGPINAQAVLPDLLEITISGWEPTNPSVDPFAGEMVTADGASIVRIDMVFAGLINPPGTIGLNGLPYDPFRYGPSPLMGFAEIDFDHDDDGDDGTGGQLGGAATLRYLANVARFGGLPDDVISERAAVNADDYDASFSTDPQFERSGEDFSIVMCGCFDVTIISQDGNTDGLFDPGETWVVQSRFFQRAGGYQDASGVFGGSDFGLYDPITELQFSHDMSSDTTTVSLVYALDMLGAAQLAGEPEQSIDSVIDLLGSHDAIVEAIQDLIDGAEGLNGGALTGPNEVLTENWAGAVASDFLDPLEWRVNALFGTAYTSPQDGLYVWTDVAFDETLGDFDGDGLFWGVDEALLADTIAQRDGGPTDGDGVVNGQVQIIGFGVNFDLFDVNSDGVIEQADLSGLCSADLTGSLDPNNPAYGVPDGIVDASDFFFYLDEFADGESSADLTGSLDPNSPDFGVPDGNIDANDFFFYLQLFANGCL